MTTILLFLLAYRHIDPGNIPEEKYREIIVWSRDAAEGC